jgi:hypothetical protein
MDNLPLVIDGADVAAGTVHEDLDLPMLPSPGGWDTDSRLCLMAASPRPCMVMAAVVDVTTNEQARERSGAASRDARRCRCLD